jgi:serine phosphatase RsbU (regulator of sigma subunit)
VSHIILADDFGVNRKILKTFLRKMDELIIHEATDGFQVMELLGQYDIDLVLLDLMMPGKDGFAVMQEMKQHEEYKHIPIIVQSALAENEYVTQVLQLGAYDYFHKELGDSLMENTLVLKVTNAINSYSLHKQIQRELTAKYFFQERLNKDLALASLVQQGFLPDDIDGENFCSKTLYQPLHVVSGDLYDYKWDETKQVLNGYILDISGHGVATALITSALKSSIEQGFTQYHSPQEKVEWLNQAIMPYCCEAFYAAIICFEMNFNSQMITYASGGIHHFLCISDGKWEFITIPGSPIGLFKNAPFQQHTRSFHYGDTIIFFSDGIADLLERPFVKLDIGFMETMDLFQSLCDTEKIRDDATVVAIHIKKSNDEAII